MNRKRALISDTFNAKRRRVGTDHFGTVCNKDGALDIRSTLEYLMTLFPRKLFNDALPRIVLKHQLYSLHRDKTMVDKELNKLREGGELLMFQLGFDAEAYGLVFASDYKAKVLAGQEGRETQEVVGRFLEKALPSCTDLSFGKDRMLRGLLFTDSEITQLVKSGVLTVRDAGSWWLSIPNSGKFTKYFIQGGHHTDVVPDVHTVLKSKIFPPLGRKAVLNMVRKSKYGEVLQAELEERKTPSQVKFHMKYLINDIVGAELVQSVPTTSGTLLRFVDS